MDEKLLKAVLRLKDVKRKGWVESGIDEAESVADHTCGVALYSLFLSAKGNLQADKKFDTAKVLTMALIHDLAEAVVGDITPADNVPVEEKRKMERDALEDLLSGLPEACSKEFLDIWDELQDGKTPEAGLVLDVDVFERIGQAMVYAEQGYDVKRFFDNVDASRIFSEMELDLLKKSFN